MTEVTRVRPWTVTAAAGLQALLAVIGLFNGVFAIATRGITNEAMREFALAHDQEPKDSPAFTMVCVLVLSLALAVAFLVLAYFNLRGANPARITTWVLVGVFGCCGLGGSLLSIPFYTYYPAWYVGISAVVGVISLLAYIGVAVLLALPASNEYFRKPEPEFVIPGEVVPPTEPPAES